MISFRNVAKHYGAIEALKGVSFEVPRGEIFGYIGPNGAGKTTSLRILSGLLSVFEGEVSVAGSSLKSSRREAQALLGYVPQNAGFQEWRTVGHALNTFAKLSGVDTRAPVNGITAVIDRFDLSEHLKRKIVHLSGGTIQKVNIAQALLHDPKVLVLDEPLTGLDPSNRFEVKQILKELKKEGKTIMLSSHILSDVEDVADRIGIIHNGKLLKSGTLQELRNEYRVGLLLKIETDSSLRTRDALKAVEGIESTVQVDDICLHVRVSSGRDLDEISRRIQSKLLENRIPIRSFIRAEPSLEEVYLSLTR